MKIIWVLALVLLVAANVIVIRSIYVEHHRPLAYAWGDADGNLNIESLRAGNTNYPTSVAWLE